MDSYYMKSPVYYAVQVKGRKVFQNNGYFYYVLENEDEVDEFSKTFDIDWSWNMKKGELSFKYKGKGVPLARPTDIGIGNVVTVYDDWSIYDNWGELQFNVWTEDEFNEKFHKR